MIERWSFSQWESYNSCPARWNYASVQKLPRLPPGPAAARGLLIHDTVESYITGRADEAGLHAAVKRKFLPVLDSFRDHPNGERHTELKLGLDREWNVSLVGDAAVTNKKSWCIMVFDAIRVGGPWQGQGKGSGPNIAYIGEWKSGKPKDTHIDQRKLYILGAFAKWEGLDEVHATTYYLEDTHPPQRTVAKASAVDKLKSLWQGRVDQMDRDAICGPKPGIHCNWCDFAKKRGGPCAFGM